jgi:hypothetical protein
MNITPLALPRTTRTARTMTRTTTTNSVVASEMTLLAALVVSQHRLAYWNWAKFQHAANLRSPAGLSVLRRLKAEAMYLQQEVWEAEEAGHSVDFKEVKAHLWAYFNEAVKPDRRERDHY